MINVRKKTSLKTVGKTDQRFIVESRTEQVKADFTECQKLLCSFNSFMRCLRSQENSFSNQTGRQVSRRKLKEKTFSPNCLLIRLLKDLKTVLKQEFKKS